MKSMLQSRPTCIVLPALQADFIMQDMEVPVQDVEFIMPHTNVTMQDMEVAMQDTDGCIQPHSDVTDLWVTAGLTVHSQAEMKLAAYMRLNETGNKKQQVCICMTGGYFA